MFRAVLSDVDILKNSIPVIAEIIDEGVLKVDQNGLSMVSPDRAMVAVIDFKILSSAFDEFKVDSPASLGLNMANLSAVLKRVKSGDKIIMESGDNRLRITLEGEGKRTFEIPLLDISVEKPPVDKLNFTGRVELDSGLVESGISDADVVGDAIVMEASPSSFKMHAKGDVSSTEFELKKGDGGLLSLEAQGTVKAQYPLEYLKKMIKAGKLSKQIMLEFGKDYPLRISFKSLDKMALQFILAPRIES